jgi:hypothetical protein
MITHAQAIAIRGQLELLDGPGLVCLANPRQQGVLDPMSLVDSAS